MTFNLSNKNNWMIVVQTSTLMSKWSTTDVLSVSEQSC